MKPKAASVIIVTLLLTGALTSMFATHLVLAKTETSEEKKTLLNDDVQLAGNATKHTKEEIEEQVSILEHKVTPLELEQLKGAMGVRKESENYNQVINGHGTGLRPPTEDEWKRIADSAYIVDTVTYPAAPSSVDQSATPWFPPIGNQDGEGSCTAWAVGYYVKTFQEAKEHAWDLSGATWEGGYYGHPTSSYQNRITSPDFIYHLINEGVDAGSSFLEAIQLVSFVGACSWEKMPNDPVDHTTWPSEEAWTEAPLFRGDSTGSPLAWVDTDSGIANLKNWIASQHLAVIAVDANKYPGLTSSDFWTLNNYVNPLINHANTIVGYDDGIAYIENGQIRHGAFKVANSWGVGGWEKVSDGFYWISYEAMKKRVRYCYFYLDRIGYEPELLASFEISHSKRDDCDITVGVGDYSSPLATKRFNDYVDGGAHPFCPNKILFDVTEFIDVISSIYGQTYLLGVYDDPVNYTTGTIESFAIEHVESFDPPIATINGHYVFAEVLLSQGVGTAVSFTLSPNPASPGQTVELHGTLTEVGGGPVYPAQVRVEYSTDGGATWSYAWTLSANAAGEFSKSFTAPGAGTYRVRVSYAGSATYNPSSHTETLTVGAPVWGDYHFRINPWIDVMHIKISGNVVYGVEEAPGYSDAPLLGYVEGSAFYIFIDFPEGLGYELMMLMGSTSTLSGNAYRTIDGTSWDGPTSFTLTSASSASGSSATGQTSASAVEPQSWPATLHFRINPFADVVHLSADGAVLHGQLDATTYHDQPVLGYVSGNFFIFATDYTEDDFGNDLLYELSITVGSVSTKTGNMYRTTDGKSWVGPTAINLVSAPP